MVPTHRRSVELIAAAQSAFADQLAGGAGLARSAVLARTSGQDLTRGAERCLSRCVHCSSGDSKPTARGGCVPRHSRLAEDSNLAMWGSGVRVPRFAQYMQVRTHSDTAIVEPGDQTGFDFREWSGLLSSSSTRLSPVEDSTSRTSGQSLDVCTRAAPNVGRVSHAVALDAGLTELIDG